MELEHTEDDEDGHTYPFAVLEVEQPGECGGGQDGPAEPDGVDEAAVAVAFVGVEPAAGKAFALRGVHIGCRLKRKCEKAQASRGRVCAWYWCRRRKHIIVF
ncbi:hypothetical protein NEILACOT_03234 [Neisseria lactamica ATCC 23970]|uniref:Uncharacterized protein n=1 Tax=Neisseria lactamica ATCC 23970 TaxID=546265 RepID=D0W6U4_NEILA|nr:hypothetical protein NEILACOT_03234 [Neisseria lactamica ATCC 23970]